VRGTPSGKQTVIVGLGNPGKNYSRQRHNLGFRVVDELALEAASSWKDNRRKALVCEARIDTTTVFLVKPQTFMNLSGHAVEPILRKLNADPGRMVVVHDDLDLSAGKVRIKIGGGDGGHKGVRSIADSIRFRDFIRVRLGVGRPPEGSSAEEFVLNSFLEEEEDLSKDLIQTGCRAVQLVVMHGVEQAQNMLYATKIVPPLRASVS
jgi:peptidyl-tRNA hydrolase, PTH1 family